MLQFFPGVICWIFWIVSMRFWASSTSLRSAGLKGRIVSTLIVCTYMDITCRVVVTLANLIIVLLWCAWKSHISSEFSSHFSRYEVLVLTFWWGILILITNNFWRKMIYFLYFMGTKPDTLATSDTISDYYLVANIIIDILNTILTICSEYSINLKKF